MAVLKMSPSFYQKYEVLARLGYIFARTNQVDNAIQYFESSISEKSFGAKRTVDILLKLGLLKEEKEQLEAAMECYNNASQKDEDNTYQIYQHQAWLLLKMGQPNQALEYLNKADQISNGDLETIFIRARCLQQMQYFIDAVAQYEILCEVPSNKNSAVFLCSYAVLLYNQGKFKEAFEKIINATKLNSKMFESWYNFGILYEKCKQSNEAIVAYRKAIEI